MIVHRYVSMTFLLLVGALKPEQLRGAESIVQAVGALQHVQAAVAQGDANALSSKPLLLKRIGGMLSAIDPRAEISRREFSAVGIYLLSGGDPRHAGFLFKDASIKERAPFLFGAFAYATGHRHEAQTYLTRPDAKMTTFSFGAHAAYALSVLNTDENRKEALSLLDNARLMAPGTLIEEVSLRREALLIAQEGGLDQLSRLMRQYYLRYSKSPYARDFAHTLAAALVAHVENRGDRVVEVAIDGSRRMPNDARIDFLLSVTREIVLAGKYVAAIPAASAVRSIAQPGSEADARARLYHFVADFLRGGVPSDEELEALDSARLPPLDRELLVATKQLIAQVRTPLPDHLVAGDEADRNANARSSVGSTAETGARALAAASDVLGKRLP